MCFMLDKTKLLSGIHQQIQALQEAKKQNTYYTQQYAIDKAIEELYKLKMNIEQGLYNVRIW